MNLISVLFGLFVLTSAGSAVLAGTSAQVGLGAEEFFEKEVRPILVERCQSCHGETKAQGGLRLTNRILVLKGGARGPALVPAQPEQSLLFGAVQYRAPLKIPPTGNYPTVELRRFHPR